MKLENFILNLIGQPTYITLPSGYSLISPVYIMQCALLVMIISYMCRAVMVVLKGVFK